MRSLMNQQGRTFIDIKISFYILGYSKIETHERQRKMYKDFGSDSRKNPRGSRKAKVGKECIMQRATTVGDRV